jgi:hypothetical protein
LLKPRARGWATAIRAAILRQRTGAGVEEALRQAIDAGIPPRHERLFGHVPPPEFGTCTHQTPARPARVTLNMPSGLPYMQ